MSNIEDIRDPFVAPDYGKIFRHILLVIAVWEIMLISVQFGDDGSGFLGWRDYFLQGIFLPLFGGFWFFLGAVFDYSVNKT